MVVLRGDIDALRLPDVKDVPYRSEVPGVCHACGHDVHATCVLGAGLALARQRRRRAADGCGCCSSRPRRRCPGGAAAMVEAGLVDGAGAIFALHCDPNLEVGTVGLSPGPDHLGVRPRRHPAEGPRRPHRPGRTAPSTSCT